MVHGVFRQIKEDRKIYYQKLNNSGDVEGLYEEPARAQSISPLRHQDTKPEKSARLYSITKGDLFLLSTNSIGVWDVSDLESRCLTSIEARLDGREEKLTQALALVLTDETLEGSFIGREPWYTKFKTEYSLVTFGQAQALIHCSDVLEVPDKIIEAISLVGVKERAFYSHKLDEGQSSLSYLDLLNLRKEVLANETDRFSQIEIKKETANAIFQKVAMALSRGLGERIQDENLVDESDRESNKPNTIEQKSLETLRHTLNLINEKRPEFFVEDADSEYINAQEKVFLNLYLTAVERAIRQMRNQTFDGAVEMPGKHRSKTGSRPAAFLEEALRGMPASGLQKEIMRSERKRYANFIDGGLYKDRAAKPSVDALKMSLLSNLIEEDTAEVYLFLTNVILYMKHLEAQLELIRDNSPSTAYTPLEEAAQPEFDASDLYSLGEITRLLEASRFNPETTKPKFKTPIQSKVSCIELVKSHYSTDNLVGSLKYKKHGSIFLQSLSFFVSQHEVNAGMSLGRVALPGGL